MSPYKVADLSSIASHDAFSIPSYQAPSSVSTLYGDHHIASISNGQIVVKTEKMNL
ncbi:hypothetical protein CIPAW_15G159700 [Carya illinoinensis]|uniref:Uncharacterized protein n=1 Tax=Carya illinoinensis TaxID=32201 RepID=A0A8T1NFY0_CARIL|nr:hypothetical protein CIPAW_15G159700 [Carya illinoinensis]